MPPTKTNQQAIDESTAVAKKAASMIGGSYKQGVGFTPTQKPAPTNMVQDGTVDASQINAPSAPQMPEPNADAEAETFQVGLQQQVKNADKALQDTLKRERDAALKRQEELNKKLESIQKESDPENRATFQQEQRIIQNQLDAAETASETIEEDFKKRRATVSELDTLLTEGNQLIAQKKNQPVALSVLNKSTNRTIQDIQARAGVLQAVLSGVDGNITMAHSIINTAQGTVRTYWQDQVNYNNAYMNLVNSGELAKNKIESDYAQSQITLAENKLTQLEETSDYINKLMIDPSSAQFIADAGVTLNDSVEEINTKLAEQTRKVEITDTINELKLDGYTYVPFAGDREDVVSLEVGGETLSFVPPPEEVSGSSKKPKVSMVNLTPTEERNLIAAGLLASDIEQIQKDVSEFGLDSVLEGIDNEAQRQAVAEAYGREPAAKAPPTADDIKAKVVSTLSNVQDTYSRSEAEELARTNLQDALGQDVLPQSFEDAIQDALVEVYGRTFWQSVLPGGR